MGIYHATEFILPLPDGHRFPMDKYQRLHDRIATHFPNLPLNRPPAALERQLIRVHSPSYVHAVFSGQLEPSMIRRIGFPWSPQLVERSRRSVGASIAAARSALESGRGINLAGGTHHASRSRGSGYCVFNDLAVAARAMQTERRAQNILIFDFDVHQGDGTAQIFSDDPTVRTVSIHGALNFPFEKPKSDIDIPLPDNTTDDVYLESVEDALSRGFALGPVDLVFYLAGADPYVDDTLGRLAVSMEGLAHRDALVYAACERHGVPCATAMGGGYARDVESIVDIHFETVKRALKLT